jgi:hypothetical protein
MRVDLVYIEAGGGHRASALALEAAIRRERPHWRPRLVNLFKVLDPQDQFRRVTGFGPADFYNKRLARGWTLGMAQELKLFQFSIALLHEKTTTQLHAWWSQGDAPELVVSLVPNFNRAIYAALARCEPPLPLVTLLTDLADNPPSFWIEPRQLQDIVCGTARAEQQALAMGYDRARVHRTSGMVLHPRFHDSRALDASERAAARARHGLDPARLTGLVLFGGTGSMRMRRMARRLPDTQLILMCGRNAELAAKLREDAGLAPGVAPRLVVEFTDDMPAYMRLADFLIGKPGPGSLSEAVAMDLPVIVEANAWTMPQELYNVDWVREHGLGVLIRSLAQLPAAVAQISAELPRFRARLAQMQNRAVFEVLPILEGILRRQPAAKSLQEPWQPQQQLQPRQPLPRVPLLSPSAHPSDPPGSRDTSPSSVPASAPASPPC